MILRLAKRRDEVASNLVAFPARGAMGGDARCRWWSVDDGYQFEEIEIEELHQEGEMRAPTNIEQPATPTAAIGRADIDRRLSGGAAAGGRRRNPARTRAASEELAGVVAYAHRLGQLAGELLGLDPFVAMECTFADGRFLIFDEENGETVALRPRPDTNLQPLRDRLGL